MAGILDLLNSETGQSVIENISNATGLDLSQSTDVVAKSLPTMLGAMQNNAQSDGGSLLSALTSGKHDGGLLDNLGSFFGNSDFSEGSKILGHVFGNEENTVVNKLSSETGVQSSIISKILPMLAPIVMAYLAKQMSGNSGNAANANDGGGLGSILGSVLGGLTGGGNTTAAAPSGNSGGGDILTSMLDQDGDGQLGMGDAISAITKGSSNNNSGGGGLLGGIFGKLFGKK